MVLVAFQYGTGSRRARYVNEDYGLFARCTRHFSETSVGLYAQIGEFGNNAGFFFSVPLPFKKRPNEGSSGSPFLNNMDLTIMQEHILLRTVD